MGLLNAPVRVGRSEGIDALRACLALWVILSHAYSWAAYYQGPSGDVPWFVGAPERFLSWVFQNAGETHPAVTGFIVLSGYCVHRAGLRMDRLDVRRYAIRRLFRIYPIYLAAIVAGIAGFTISTWHLSSALQVAGTSSIEEGCVLARVLALGAVWQPLHRCLFLGNAPLNTVMAEIGLYVVYPVILLVVARRWNERGVWIALGTIVLGGVAVLTLWPHMAHWWNTASVFGFLSAWWIGAKACDPDFQAWLARHRVHLVLGWALLSLFVLFVWAPPILVEARKLALSILFALLIVRLDGIALPRWLLPLSVLGLAGYSLYAFHAPIMYTALIFGVPWWGTIVLAIVGAAVGYLAIERPMMSWGARIAMRRTVPAGPLQMS